ncbi:MAG TPA: DUF4115 domain-containing protein [Candidatus Omnitrophota bacterium]|nr:DUF4115 domain-containing protein [Candidatus Omnitrophota bacterium]
MYADYLGVDVSKVIEDYHTEKLPQYVEQDVETFDFVLWIKNFFDRRRRRKILVAAGIILALFLLVKMIGSLFKEKSPAAAYKDLAKKSEVVKAQEVKKEAAKIEAKRIVEESRATTQSQPPKIVVPKEVPAVKPSEMPPAPKPTQPVAAASPLAKEKAVVLTVRAKQNSWLSVKTDGKVVFQSTLRLGAVETWKAQEEIEISGKNVSQLEFELNGKMIGALGQKDRNAKKVVITKSGLSVKN